MKHRRSSSVWKQTGIDPETVETAEHLSVAYWNGAAWQPEVCSIPQAAVP
jgi:hypothetical protein